MMRHYPSTNSRIDAKTISPKPRPSAWRPPAPLSGLMVADVMVSSRSQLGERRLERAAEGRRQTTQAG